MTAPESDPLEAKLEGNLHRDFPTRRPLNDLLWQQYYIIQDYLGGFETLRDASLLDIGCGSGANPEGGLLAVLEQWYEPWLCRTQMYLGNATGVDLEGRGIDDTYEHIQADLTEVDLETLLVGRKFDFVFNSRFAPSQNIARRDIPISARLMEKFDAMDGKEDELHKQLGDKLRRGVACLLSEGGIYFEGDEVWKNEGELVSQGPWHGIAE